MYYMTCITYMCDIHIYEIHINISLSPLLFHPVSSFLYLSLSWADLIFSKASLYPEQCYIPSISHRAWHSAGA